MIIQRKPEWLKKKVSGGDQTAMRQLLGELKLATVCQQALCPNISECFSCGQATFLILGTRCTRSCSFCNVEKNEPPPPDPDEPARIAAGVARLRLAHVVITSPTRDDLEDGGAGQYAATVSAIRSNSPSTRIELLIPDLQGDPRSLATILSAEADIVGHNIETVPRLYHVRSGADYLRSLGLIRQCREHAPALKTKSGIMLGLGETVEEVIQVINDLVEAGCSYLSIGQYLAPSTRHWPVQEYVPPERFDFFRAQALAAGFAHVESGPYVRSSYHAAEYTGGDTVHAGREAGQSSSSPAGT